MLGQYRKRPLGPFRRQFLPHPIVLIEKYAAELVIAFRTQPYLCIVLVIKIYLHPYGIVHARSIQLIETHILFWAFAGEDHRLFSVKKTVSTEIIGEIAAVHPDNPHSGIVHHLI